MSSTFYQSIPYITSITEITNLSNYRDVPENWFIALTDVIGSTKAIQAGRYKEVNALAAASITALLNCVPMDIPFVFGGDGATILIPPEVVTQAQEALLATKQLAIEQFDLDLRVGVVPVKDVLADGYAIRLTKLRVSENFEQAIFTGGGISHAERLLKHAEKGQQYLLTGDGAFKADFSGFECRWNEVPGKYEETLSLIVQAVVPDIQEQYQVYREVLGKIEEIYGKSDVRHPLSPHKMQLNFLPWSFLTEARIRYRDTGFARLWRMAKGTFKANIAMRFNIQNWGGYKQILIESTDSEKFDDTLRTIISGTTRQREALRDYLEEQRQQGRLVYGTHTSQTALITCIVFDYFGRQVHFVDGSNGGYALAAKEMKAQMGRVDVE